mmetsp:Transcript_19848/g.79091  ORF Transcript_19848/g.79091 Transcript_19848/m.79091 type:complete len:289 (-) Transcript_19848:1441-2307(-)
MGCPKRFSLTDGMGAALLRDPARAAAIVRSMRAACPDDVAVSAKIRFAGTAADEAAAIDATEALCRALDAAGAAAITLHCRYAGDAPERTPCHRETARRLVRRLREGADEFRAALLLNGDFYDVDDARQACRGPGGVDGILVARPALLNPSLFRRADPLPRLVVMRDYVDRLVRYDMNYKNAKYVVMEMLAKRRHPARAWNARDEVPEAWTIERVSQTRSVADIAAIVGGGQQSFGVSSSGAATDGRRYDDDYFLKADWAAPQQPGTSGRHRGADDDDPERAAKEPRR